MRQPSRSSLIAITLSLCTAFAGAQTPGPAPLTYARVRALTAFSEHGVRAEVSVDKDSAGGIWLSCTYTPTEPGSYLYSKDLPPAGVEGLGRPTLLAVVAPSNLKAIGPVVADRAPKDDHIDVLDVTLAVYPPGPVTLRIPVELPPANVSPRVELSIGYMACGPKGCLPPVDDKRVIVNVR